MVIMNRSLQYLMIYQDDNTIESGTKKLLINYLMIKILVMTKVITKKNDWSISTIRSILPFLLLLVCFVPYKKTHPKFFFTLICQSKLSIETKAFDSIAVKNYLFLKDFLKDHVFGLISVTNDCFFLGGGDFKANSELIGKRPGNMKVFHFYIIKCFHISKITNRFFFWTNQIFPSFSHLTRFIMRW